MTYITPLPVYVGVQSTCFVSLVTCEVQRHPHHNILNPHLTRPERSVPSRRGILTQTPKVRHSAHSTSSRIFISMLLVLTTLWDPKRHQTNENCTAEKGSPFWIGRGHENVFKDWRSFLARIARRCLYHFYQQIPPYQVPIAYNVCTARVTIYIMLSNDCFHTTRNWFWSHCMQISETVGDYAMCKCPCVSILSKAGHTPTDFQMLPGNRLFNATLNGHIIVTQSTSLTQVVWVCYSNSAKAGSL